MDYDALARQFGGQIDAAPLVRGDLVLQDLIAARTTADPEAMEPEPWSIPCFDEQRRFVAPC